MPEIKKEKSVITMPRKYKTKECPSYVCIDNTISITHSNGNTNFRDKKRHFEKKWA